MLGLGLSIPCVAVRGGITLSQQVASLFSAGEVGVWYDPSDFSTMYQDSAGTTPVTAVEQPVGLMLDKRKGLVLGPELCTDPGFDTPSAWSFAGVTPGWSVSGGKAEVTQTATGNRWVSNGARLTVGKTYLVTADVTRIAGSCAPDMSSVAAGDATSSGAKRWIVTASIISLQFIARVDFIGSIDNISVRELPGNHATQATSTKRPVLSARVNLLTKTEDFSDAVWTKTAAGTGVTPVVVSNAEVAPDGTETADKVVFSAYASGDQSTLGQTVYNITVGNRFSSNMWIKAFAAGDIGKQVLLRQAASSSYTVVTLTADWAAYSVLNDAAVSNYFTYTIGLRPVIGGGSAGTVSCYIWGASIVPADQASLPYQRVNTATDYDTVGFKHYLKFDGVDDALATGSINFSATDKMTVWAGVRKLSDAAIGMIAELGPATGTSNPGSFNILAPSSTGNVGANDFQSTGTLFVNARSVLAAPVSAVLSGLGNISGDLATLRVNGAQVAQSTADQGTGNYGNYPLFVGSRAGTSLPFNGHLYSLIIRGAASTTAQIVSAETYVNSKTGAY